MRIIFAVVFCVLSCLSAHATEHKVYLWVKPDKHTSYRHGIKISVNKSNKGTIWKKALVELTLIGDKKYTVELFDQDHSLGSVDLDKPTDSLTYYALSVSASGYNTTVSAERIDAITGGLYVINKNNYNSQLSAYEEGMDQNVMEDDAPTSGLSYGSGFLISADGYIVTNNHVVDGHKVIKVKGVEGDFTTEYEADVVTKDVNNDLVLLQLKNKTVKFSTPPYTIRAQGASTGEDISVLGYPLGPALGDEIKLTTGVISAKSGVGGNVSSYQVSASAQPGNSGGPLFDSHGGLLGVVNAKIKNAENITYAVKSIYLQALLGMLPTQPKVNEANTISDKTLPERVAAISKFVYIIKSE